MQDRISAYPGRVKLTERTVWVEPPVVCAGEMYAGEPQAEA